MGYYIRVLSKSSVPIPVSQLRDALDLTGTKIDVEVGEAGSWSHLRLLHDDPEAPFDGVIAVIERNPVEPGSLGSGEIAEFLDEIETHKPESSRRWLRDYVLQVRVIYCFQVIHQGAEWRNGWHALHTLQEEIRETHGGIFQADYEGFSNEDGYHILWQFSGLVSGPWKMAVLGPDNQWMPFEMDLGNQKHREAFFAGKIPDGANRL